MPGAAGIMVELGSGVKEKLGKGGERGRKAEGRKWNGFGNGLGRDGALEVEAKGRSGVGRRRELLWLAGIGLGRLRPLPLPRSCLGLDMVDGREKVW